MSRFLAPASAALLALAVLALTSCVGAGNRTPAGMVASATAEASLAGVEILEAGGNAVDAAVAVAFALGVTEPAGSGIGGQAFFIIHPPGGQPFVINGTSLAPGKLPGRVTSEDISGHRATTVPSAVRVLEFAWKNYGSGRITWSQLLEPAIRFAEDGYPLGHFRHRSLARYAHRVRENPVAAQLLLGPGGALPRVNTVVRQPELARTLRRLAEAGAEDFYSGRIAEQIAADMEANGGWITLDDLKSFPQPRVGPPLRTTYRGWDVYSLPPPTGGWVVLQALNILEQADASQLAGGASERWVWLAESLRVCHDSRVQRPIDDLRDYQEEAARKVAKSTAERLMQQVDRPGGGGETTHFSIIDGDGLGVGVTASLNAYFGARAASPELGFLYNDYMREFDLDRPESPYNLTPRGLPYSSMSASILARNGQVGLVVGSPGSKRIISAVVQVISHWVDVGRGVVAAVAAPRLHVVPPDDLYIEARQARLTASLLLALELRGYSIVRPLSSLYREELNPYFGGVHAVANENGELRGAADPRRDGRAIGAWR